MNEVEEPLIVVETKANTESRNEKIDLSLHIENVSTFSLAAQQNAYPIFRKIRLDYYEPESDENKMVEELPSLQNLVVKLESSPKLIESEQWAIDLISPGQSVTLQERPLSIPHKDLFEMTEETRLEVILTVYRIDEPNEVLVKQVLDISVLPPNFWGGESRQPDLLAAFVKPNGAYVESLVREVTKLMEKGGHDRSADGYQSNSREKPYLMAAYLWNVIFNQKLSYVNPPQGFARSGQRVRLAADISSSKLSACLDTSLLFASCLELMGLNPVIALTEGHAFVGVWLIDESFPVLTNDDPMDLRKRVDNRDIVLFESTLVTNSSPVTFEQAKSYARQLIEEDKESEFVYVIDIKQARARKIKPLSTVEIQVGENEADSGEVLEVPVLPPLPPVRVDERKVEETPETRVDTWQRKLLDLTKRNPLLSLKDRAVAIKIYCPDIGLMEDRLADGISFKFLSVEESPMSDDERSRETFRMQAGSDLHREFAKEQLEKGILLANMSKKKLEQQSVSLLRKAKNDLEEGGANTLYLALGMLRWKESPNDDRSYRAPLILLPAELVRKSARAPVKVRQLADENPIFNSTLIEFLFTEHNIDLNQFRESLPEDESGVDVNLIWTTVRHAVSEQPGFEVVEELVLSSFSFTKYLMWKDLKDRICDLKENPFVKHLIDNPREAYHQETSFVLRDEVDEKIDPESIFTPLNCDSSQLVAVEASSKPQDFVLEGPPGTGKSETIANIICHNLAQGKKVLFVAEKMAALNVVYRRLEKVGLDHLCLELHSSKSNKKAVLEQLRIASEKREYAKDSGWVKRVNQLKVKRDHLNELVTDLHKDSVFGISPREAISRVVVCRDTHSLNLGWSEGFESSPVKNKTDLASMLESVKRNALAYKDVETLDTAKFKHVKAKYWSNSWQANVVECLRDYRIKIDEAVNSAKDVLEVLQHDIEPNTQEKMFKLKSFSNLIGAAEKFSFGFLLQGGAPETLEKLNELGHLKRRFEEKLLEVGHNASPEILEQTPIKNWLGKRDSARTGWFQWLKKWIVKFQINSEAVKVGYAKFNDLTILNGLDEAKTLMSAAKKISDPFVKDSIWEGWDTTGGSLAKTYDLAKETLENIREFLSLGDDPSSMLSQIKVKLVDGRDFLVGSKISIACDKFAKKWNSLESIKSVAEELNLYFEKEMEFDEILSSIDCLESNTVKFKPWSEWQAARVELVDLRLDNLIVAFESNLVRPESADQEVLTAFCRWLAPQLIDQSDILREFKASTHEEMIKEFRRLDKEVADTTSAYIAAITSKNTPDPFAKGSPKEFGVLARELQKKTRHKPVRTLINEMGRNLLDLCPCMMMSPLSVAQFLPSNFNEFDLVLFDEASQMTTWDSVGAIARGKHVIVVGDPKQMPPTNFFNASSDSGDADEEDLESILDQALAARLPHLRLKGHYRSRHETLIAFSNSKYYENSLMTYPASETKETAVTLHRVNGIYAKGKSRNNPIEAKAVVDEIVRRLTCPAEVSKTIGVVTLNSEQQRTIEDLLDDARRAHPEIEPFFQQSDEYDSVFVKNLESVQGDERDVIILSLGYGPTEPGANNMSMNFGPLNKQGGERRLNVAITRATTEVLVFASFDSSMIDLSRTSATAIEHLKHYLEFSERGPKSLAEQAVASHGTDQFDSEFEESVAWQLREKGWKIQTQVGVSKFRVDLGIIHPEVPGSFLAGVECDGATYHGSPSARDRDRVRHGILEGLGWRLVRLWSTEYYRDPIGAIDKIDEELKEILRLDLKERDKVKKLEQEAQNRRLDVPTSPQEESVKKSEELYDHSLYFDEEYEPTLIQLAREILKVKNGITLHELVLDIANFHGLTRTSKKQVDHITKLISSWAGISKIEGEKDVVWLSPDDIVEEIPWRGVDAFEGDREWSRLPFPECIGLAKFALEKSPSKPVDYMCELFDLKRRHEKTLEKFGYWVEVARERGEN